MHLIQALKNEKESFAELGIDIEEKAFYDILKFLTIKYDFKYSEDKLLKLSKEVKTVIDDKAKYTDWSQRVDIKSDLVAATSPPLKVLSRRITAAVQNSA